MGLATIDSHSQKEHTDIHKFLSLVLIRLVFTEILTAISKRRNLQRNVWHPDAVSESVRIAIHFSVNFGIFKLLYLAYFWFYLHQTWGFCKAWSALNDYVDQ